jgi:hypothetical protein
VTRVIVADGCHQLDSPLTGRRYYAKGARALEGSVRGGVFDMHPADAAMAVKMGGAIASEAGTARRALGWRCPACGFGSFLKRCGRCGAECEREGGGNAGTVAVAVDPDPQADEAGDAPAEGEAVGVGEEGREDEGRAQEGEAGG